MCHTELQEQGMAGKLFVRGIQHLSKGVKLQLRHCLNGEGSQ